MPLQAFSPFSIGIFAVIAVVSTVYIYFKNQNENSPQHRHENNSSNRTTSPLSPNQGSHYKGSTTEDTCPICQQTLSTNKQNFMLGCAHLLHLDCAKRLVENIATCPICRYTIHPNLINKIKSL